MQLKNRITDLLLAVSDDVMSEEASKAWRDWLDLKPNRSEVELQHLVEGGIGLEFKLRAITVLLAADSKLLPFAWQESFSRATNISSRDKSVMDISSLSEEIVSLIGELVALNVDYVLRWDISGNRNRKTAAYDKFIRDLLTQLPKDHPVAEKLFGCHQLREPTPYFNPEFASNYEPFKRFMFRDNIPLSWKQKLDKRMRKRIRRELSGEVSPRESWEDALGCYINHLSSACFDGSLRYDRDLFISQLQFLADQKMETNYQAHRLSLLFVRAHSHISGDGLTELRLKLTRLVTTGFESEDYHGFRVYGKDTYRVAKSVIDDCREAGDNELVVYLSYMIDNYEQEIAQNAADARRRNRKVNDTLKKMQAPD